MIDILAEPHVAERLHNDCERLAIAIYGSRTVVLLDQSSDHRAYLQLRGERLTQQPSRYCECHASTPVKALLDLHALLLTKAVA